MGYVNQNRCSSRLGQWDVEANPFEKKKPEVVLKAASKDAKTAAAIEFAFSPIKNTAKYLLRRLYKAPTEEEKMRALVKSILIEHGLIPKP